MYNTIILIPHVSSAITMYEKSRNNEMVERMCVHMRKVPKEIATADGKIKIKIKIKLIIATNCCAF